MYIFLIYHLHVLLEHFFVQILIIKQQTNNYILLQLNDLHVQYLNFYLLRLTRILANLNVDEEEIYSQFSVSIQFSGRITATIATRQSPNTCLKFIVGDIVQIIGKAIID